MMLRLGDVHPLLAGEEALHRNHTYSRRADLPGKRRLDLGGPSDGARAWIACNSHVLSPLVSFRIEIAA